MGWAIWILLILIILLLIKIIRDLKKLHDAGAHDGPSAATIKATQAFQGALVIIRRVKDENRPPTAAECQQLKQLWEEAQGGDLSGLSLNPLKVAIDELCPTP